ncbi:MAG TPA: hypothetical protein VL485_21420 [Ktedonobacteraceae bacterium]|nr:hypothetical protein [Ktedonobacteraceae bacterium]
MRDWDKLWFASSWGMFCRLSFFLAQTIAELHERSFNEREVAERERDNRNDDPGYARAEKLE